MKALAILLVLSSNAWAQCTDTGMARFRIFENNRHGFIDETGNIAIPPQYLSAHDFSEGSCAVRIGGKYGYINPEGEVCIAPIYDFAYPFKKGLALVYLDGKPLFIDTNGSRAFASPYKSLSEFTDGIARVLTTSNKMGMIDTKGKLVIDTVFSVIYDFSHGLAIVEGLNHHQRDKDDELIDEMSVIDSRGNLLLPYGAYPSIDDNSEGYFQAARPIPGKHNDWVYHLYNGKTLLHKFPKNNITWPDEVHEGILGVTFEKNSNEYFHGYMTTEGKLIFKDRDAEKAYPFLEQRAFVKIDKRLSILDRSGKFVARNVGFDLKGEGFVNGKALVQDSNGWKVIDCNGNTLVATQFGNVYDKLIDDFIFFADSEYDASGRLRYGMMDLAGNILIAPTLNSFDDEGFKNGLLQTYSDTKLTYFDRSGKMVWQEKLQPDQTQVLNIDYMNRAYYYVKQQREDGGWDDIEEKISDDLKVDGSSVMVVANTKKEMASHQGTRGFEVYVANTTSDSIWFNAQDTRLYMKIQAKDVGGQWRDIEYSPSSWCGNSYHSMALSKGHLWKFTAPFYEGSMTTKLRIEVQYVDPSDITAEDEGRYRGKKQLKVYSNEFDGSVNPAQFWRKPEYHPGGIMDPYFD